MAISHTYCDFATGNDYKGATFTDGSFDSATLTLTKTSAFADSQVNHWLYLDDNGSGEVTPGYYRITTVASADAVVLHADIRSGVNDPTDVVCTQHDGTTTLPWRSVQGALDLITRDATNGDQVNVKAGTAQVNSATLTLAIYGAPSESAPLIFRGYTTMANDGGRAEIDANGFTMIVSAPFLVFIDLEMHNFGNNNGIDLFAQPGCAVMRCKVHKGQSSPNTKALVRCYTVIGCEIYDAGIAGYGIMGPKLAMGNYVHHCSNGIATNISGAIMGNILHSCTYGISSSADEVAIIGNTVVSINSPGTGIGTAQSLHTLGRYLNNLVAGYGTGLCVSGGYGTVIGNNAYYNNVIHETIYNAVELDLGGAVVLDADPFIDAANGDFSLTDAAKTALADAGWPQSYLGAHVNTNPHITIGAIQQGLASGGGGFPKIASLLGRTRM